MKEKLWDNMSYVILFGLLFGFGQFAIGKNYILGQGAFIVVDVVVVVRDFILKRPKSDKIKNISMTIAACSVFAMNAM